ncbi:MAG TPA: NUDIX hydrolase [Candidatus Saccharimonadales bacterium]|nr:NUDIX hydrolase [Candidatus Saccharimonadales bacterium]
MEDSHANPWKTLASKVVYKNRWYSVRKDTVITPSGKQGEYNVVDHADAVFIVAMDENENIHLVGLYRYPTDMYSLEVPAGGSDGQDPLEAAKRELQEETGLQATNWKLLGKVQSANGFLNEFAYMYLATGLTNTNNHEQAEEGIMEHQKVSLDKALTMIKSGDITDCQSVAAISLAALQLGKIRNLR